MSKIVSINDYLSPRALAALAVEIDDSAQKTGFFEVTLVFRDGKLRSIDKRTSISINLAVRALPDDRKKEARLLPNQT